MVYTIAGEVLLLRRVRPPDFWQSVTGSLRWDETDPSQAARRELAEETGLEGELPILDCQHSQCFPIKPEWRARYAPGVTENREHVFRLELPAPVPIRLSRHEHSEYLWLPRDQAAAKTTSWTNREAILRWVPER